MTQQPNAQTFTAALDLLDQGVSILDTDYRMVYCNEAAQRLLDLPPGLVRPGTSLLDIFRYNAERGEYGPGSPEDLVAERKALLELHTEHKFDRIRPNGTVIEINGKPLPDGGFITIYTDITDLKLAHDQLRMARDSLEKRVRERTGELMDREKELAHQTSLLEATLENISQGISVFDKDLKLALYNDHFIRLLGFPEEFGRIGKPLAAFFRYNAERGEYGGGDVETLVNERLDLARTPQPHSFSRTLADDTVIEVTGNPMPQITGGFVTTYSDVTARVRAQEAAVSAKDEAEAALAKLKEAQQSLVQAEKMAALGQLVAGVAHEINTPVGVSLTMATYLEDKLGTLIGAFEQGRLKRSEMIRFITHATEAIESTVANLRRAAELVEGFKKIAVDQTTEKRRQFNLRDYTNSIALSLQSQLTEKNIRISLDCPGDLEMDSYPGAYSQVVSNILLNAKEHAFRQGNDNRISLTIARDGEAHARISIRDNGCGMPKETVAKIFDPFFTTGRSQGRSGLGLPIVYNILQGQLNGSIRCRSCLDEGTVFTLTIPIAAPISCLGS